MGCCSTEQRFCLYYNLLQLGGWGDELPLLHVDDHAKVFADEDGVEMAFRQVNLQAESCEQREGDDLELECFLVRHRKQGEVVHEGKQTGSSEFATATTPPLLCFRALAFLAPGEEVDDSGSLRWSVKASVSF